MVPVGVVRSIPLVGLLATLSTAAPAEEFPLRARGRPFFFADVVATPAGPGTVQIQVSWEVPYTQLKFHADDDGWLRARYDVSVVFLNDGRQVEGDVWPRRVRVRTLGETRDDGRVATGRRVITLPAASYGVRVRVTDRSSRLDSTVEGTVRADFDRSSLGLGDLEFIRYRDGVATRNTSHEMRLGEEGHVFRVAMQPTPGTKGTVRIHWKIRDPSRETVTEGDSTLVLTGGPIALEVALATNRLSLGSHSLEVRVLGPGSESDRRTARLHVRLTPEWFELRRERALEVFAVLTGGEELERLRRAEGGNWPAAVADFWERRDPSPGSAENEYRDEIQWRMESAATLFVEPFRQPGWRTDRGRVFLEFGEPARRSRLEGTFERPASELWEYESPRRTFLFVDERGSGEYWLQG